MDMKRIGEVVKEQICIRSGNRRGMRFFIRTHLREQVDKKIRDAAVANVHAYISSGPSLCCTSEMGFFIISEISYLFSCQTPDPQFTGEQFGKVQLDKTNVLPTCMIPCFICV